MKPLCACLALLGASCGYRPASPLGRAAFENRPEELQRILHSGGLEPDDVQDALIAAARGGCGACVAPLVKRGAALEYPAGVNGWTALQHAAHKAQMASALALLEAGADPNPALKMSAAYGQSGLVRLLLRFGADPGRAVNGQNALDRALTGAHDIDEWTAGNCQTETVRVLLEHTPGLRPLQAAAPANCPGISQLLAARDPAGIQSHP